MGVFVQVLLVLVCWSGLQVNGQQVSISVDYTPPPDAVLGPNEYRAASGPLTITCQFLGATEPVTYTWDSTLGSVFGEPNSVRRRTALRGSHSGIQNCTATDSSGNSGSASITVNVVGIGVQINAGDVDGDGVDDPAAALPNNGLVLSRTITSGTHFFIFCLSESTQRDVGEIIGLDGTPVTTDSVFIVSTTNPAGISIISDVGIDMDDQGVYTCRLPDSSGTQTLEANFGIYRNDFNTAPSIDSFTYNAATRTLTCVSTGSPATTVTWERNGSPVTIDGTDFMADQAVTTRATSTYSNTLTIGTAVTNANFEGLYTCTVSNTLGSAESAAVEVTAPNPPRNFRITVEGPTTLTFSWDVPDLINGIPSAYDLTCSPTLDGIEVVSRTFPASVPPAASRSQTLTNFEEGVTYNCSLLSRNEIGSDPVCAIATTNPIAPSGPPQMFTVSAEGPRSLLFTWRAPDPEDRNGNISSYILTCSPPAPSVTFPQTIGNDVFERSLSGFTPFTDYTCTLNATNSEGNGPAATVTVTTLQDFPGRPGNFAHVTTPSDTTIVEFSWNSPAEPNGIIISYIIRCLPTLSSLADVVFNTTTDQTNTLVSNFTSGSRYTCTIAAYTIVGEGPETDGLTVITSLSSTTSSSESSNTATIIGGIVAGVFLMCVTIIVVTIICYLRWRQHSAKLSTTGTDQPMRWSEVAKSDDPNIIATECEAYVAVKQGPPPEYEIPTTECAAYGHAAQQRDPSERPQYEIPTTECVAYGHAAQQRDPSERPQYEIPTTECVAYGHAAQQRDPSERPQDVEYEPVN